MHSREDQPYFESESVRFRNESYLGSAFLDSAPKIFGPLMREEVVQVYLPIFTKGFNEPAVLGLSNQMLQLWGVPLRIPRLQAHWVLPSGHNSCRGLHPFLFFHIFGGFRHRRLELTCLRGAKWAPSGVAEVIKFEQWSNLITGCF